MHVCAEPDVVGQIPAGIIRVGIDDDIVGVPLPVGAVVGVIRSHTPEKSAELEARWSAANEAIDVAASNFSREMTVLPRMVEMIVLVGAVPNPGVRSRVNVRRGWMSTAVTVIRVLILGRTLLLARRRSRLGRWARSARGNVPVADLRLGLLWSARLRVRLPLRRWSGGGMLLRGQN